MRTLRNVSFLVLCVSWLQVPVLADECFAPGLVGYGSTQQEALEDCADYASSHCSGMCQTSCSTDAWNGQDCSAIEGGGGWTAFGRCNCVPDA